MKLRATGQQHLESTAKDLDNLQVTLNTLLKQIATLQGTVTTLQATAAATQQAVATVQAALAAGATVNAIVGNSTQTGTSTLDFTSGIMTSFTP